MNILLKKIVLPLLNLRAKKYKAIVAQAISEGIEIETSISLLDFFLDKTNFYIDSEHQKKIGKDDFIEIYDEYGVQLFRTFNMLKFSSYLIDDLFEKRMDELYERPDFYNKLRFKAGYSVIHGKHTFLTNFCPQHLVRESKENGTSVLINYKFMIPVYSREDDQIVGVLVCEQINWPVEN